MKFARFVFGKMIRSNSAIQPIREVPTGRVLKRLAEISASLALAKRRCFPTSEHRWMMNVPDLDRKEQHC